jgi:signal recognition particle subunit SRP54
MKTVAKGGVPQVPGMGPIPGAKFGGTKLAPKKKGSKSGNPAKRAAENAAIAGGASARPTAAAGSGFGLGSKPGGPSEEELASLQKFLGR